MFGSVGWGEILVLMLVALFVFGPDRLPGVVKDAGGMLRKVRGTLTGARRQIRDELGDSFPDIDPRMLNPKQFVRRTLLEDLDDFEEPPLGRTTTRPNANPKPVTPANATPASAATQTAVPAPVAAAPQASTSQASPPAPAPSEPPSAAPAAPYDPDTT